MSRPISTNQSKQYGAKHHPDGRRSSLAAAEQASSSSSATMLAKENKRPLIAVMSEDHLSASSSTPHTTCTNPIGGTQKQSFLSKFARSEVKIPKSIEKATITTDSERQKQSTTINNSDVYGSRKLNNDQSGETKTKFAIVNSLPGTQCDRVPITITTNIRGSKTGLSNSMLPSRASKSVCQTQHYTSDTPEGEQRSDNDNGDDADDDDDNDNDQVLPAWPSRIDAAALKPSLVQHQVYSLKDYSQVAGPTENVPTSNISVSGRLLKSMSQDRKVDTKAKRLSESILTSVGHSSLYPHESKSAANSRRRNPTIVPAANLAMGPATSVNSLLAPNKNSTLLGESRIDRMRKLFVSPLSLRGSTGTSGSKTSHPTSVSPRLSLQAGANMLNKPQHLMHAMYRNRVVIGSHHNRRSPMRQKQGKIKGFRVYGCPLGMANTMYPITCFGRPEIYKQQSVPYILARLCNYIEENSSKLTHEGIFRVSGNARLMEKLKTLFDHLGDAPLESESVDVATSASMLKMYLRELPEPLIPTRMNYYFFTLAKKYSSHLSRNNPNGSRASDNLTNSGQNEASSISDTQSSVDRQRLAFLRDLTKLIRKLPIDNYNLLKYLTCFLHRVALKQQSNKMSAEALGIVFGPNVFRIRNESLKGLKEQELSNQIVASIITNYRQIFDCELTDPLGNLISSNENLNSNSEQTKEVIGQSINTEIQETISTSEIRSRNIAASSSSVASTSANFETAKNIQQPRCPKHGHHSKYHYQGNDRTKMIDDSHYHDDCDEEDFDDDDDDDDDADIDELEEDEDCDDESFSPSSGSGSYCSYLASGSVDSIYEGDVEADQYDDDDVDMDSNSSSECVSETSYTPSSSHSNSDANAAGVSSSNFSSTPSLTGADQGDDFAANATSVPQGDKPCQVCKRRESAQIEASKLREQLASMTVQDSRAAHNDEQLIESDVKCVKPDVSKSTCLKAQNRSSTRKRRFDDSRRVHANAKDDSDTTATKTSSDLALDRKSISLNLRPEEKLAKIHQHQPRQSHRQNILRRRSSSASSLFRITNRYSHASRKRSAGRDERHQRSRAHSDRKRHNDSRGYSRKSRNKSHLFKKIDNSTRMPQNYEQQTNASSSKSPTEWKKGEFYSSELIAMNLPPEVRKDLVWNYVSSSFLESPDCDRYFQLRSYNSDETLLRSQDADSELIEVTKNRRRFSGQDFIQTNNEGLLVSACPQFSEIYESFEGEQSMEFKTVNRIGELDSRGLSRSSAATAVESSVISLLGDQMTNFKHSTLSLNDETDPIVQQLKVTKDFVRVLRKILTYSSSNGIGHDTFNNLIKLIGSNLGSDSCSDEYTTFYVDHITSKSTTMTLDSLKRAFNDDTARVDDATQQRLEKLLTATVAKLKKKYNNLKYIREHYYKHHFKNVQTEDKLNTSKSMSKSSGEHEASEFSRLPGSTSYDRHSTLEAGSDQEISIGSALNTPTYVVLQKHQNIATGVDESDQFNKVQKKVDSIVPSSCKFGSLCPVEFVFNVEKQLASRRISGARLVKLDDMTLAQLQSEKLELQKNLLRYEHWFGRPTTRSEYNLVGHLYERYRAIKIIKLRKQVSSD